MNSLTPQSASTLTTSARRVIAAAFASLAASALVAGCSGTSAEPATSAPASAAPTTAAADPFCDSFGDFATAIAARNAVEATSGGYWRAYGSNPDPEPAGALEEINALGAGEYQSAVDDVEAALLAMAEAIDDADIDAHLTALMDFNENLFGRMAAVSANSTSLEQYGADAAVAVPEGEQGRAAATAANAAINAYASERCS
ncbi:MAG: hypothetical protein CVT64_03985 [Actinobacteria bacterium HGW-Actinobacteria-4]|nr:MAG: hypothetical protein CVT64_03985 [Actinobacteria bacterium HGW-Actinobacteria-4]